MKIHDLTACIAVAQRRGTPVFAAMDPLKPGTRPVRYSYGLAGLGVIRSHFQSKKRALMKCGDSVALILGIVETVPYTMRTLVTGLMETELRNPERLPITWSVVRPLVGLDVAADLADKGGSAELARLMTALSEEERTSLLTHSASTVRFAAIAAFASHPGGAA